MALCVVFMISQDPLVNPLDTRCGEALADKKTPQFQALRKASGSM